MPAGYLGDPQAVIATGASFANRYTYVGVLGQLLPYLDAASLSEQLVSSTSRRGALVDPELPNPGPSAWWNYDINDPTAGTRKAWEASQFRIPAFLCPTDDAGDATPSTAVGVLLHTYQTSATQFTATIYNFGAPNNNIFGRTNYTGVGGFAGAVNATRMGVFTSERTVRQGDIKDGTSQTLMFGEGLGGVTAAGRNFAWGWMGVGSIPTTWSIGSTTAPRSTTNVSEWYQFGSRHAGGVLYGLADGSARVIGRSISRGIYVSLTGMKDKEPVSEF